MPNPNHDGILAVLEHLRGSLLQVALHTNYSGIQRAVVIFDEDPPDFFVALQPLVKFIKKKRLPEPLIVNRAFVMDSLDSFPLEFIDIQSAYTSLMATEDLIAGLSFNPADIRLQMERELKSKWLLTRQAVLEHTSKDQHVAKVMQMSRQSIHPFLKGFMALAGENPPPDLEQAIFRAATISACDLSPVVDPIAGIGDVYRYIAMLEQLNRRVQDWKL